MDFVAAGSLCKAKAYHGTCQVVGGVPTTVAFLIPSTIPLYETHILTQTLGVSALVGLSDLIVLSVSRGEFRFLAKSCPPRYTEMGIHRVRQICMMLLSRSDVHGQHSLALPMHAFEHRDSMSCPCPSLVTFPQQSKEPGWEIPKPFGPGTAES